MERHIAVSLGGRSIAVALNEENKPKYHLSEGVVHEGFIHWCNPSPPGMLVAASGTGKPVPKELDLDEGQEVTLLVREYYEVAGVIPEVLDILVNKLQNKDAEAFNAIQSAAG